MYFVITATRQQPVCAQIKLWQNCALFSDASLGYHAGLYVMRQTFCGRQSFTSGTRYVPCSTLVAVSVEPFKCYMMQWGGGGEVGGCKFSRKKELCNVHLNELLMCYVTQSGWRCTDRRRSALRRCTHGPTLFALRGGGSVQFLVAKSIVSK